MTTADVFPGEQLTAANVETGGSTSLANRITGDERAVTIPIDAAHGMAGNISAGDHVDIYAGFNVKKLKADGTPDTAAAERPVLKLLVADVLVLEAPDEGSTSIGAGRDQDSAHPADGRPGCRVDRVRSGQRRPLGNPSAEGQCRYDEP